jgi:hypothetical protein
MLHRLKGGGFRLRLKAGSVRLRRTLVDSCHAEVVARIWRRVVLGVFPLIADTRNPIASGPLLLVPLALEQDPNPMPPCMGLLLSRTLSRDSSFFFVSLFVRSGKPVSSPRPTNPGRCRAQALSRLAVAPTLPRAAIIARPYLDSSEHAGTMMMVGITFEGSPRVAHECSCGVLVFGGC